VLTVEDLKLDRVERRVERAGRRIDLTGKEFALLEYLMRNAGRRITRAMIIEHVWNLSFDTCTNVVDVYVNYSTAQVDKKKVNKLATAIQVAFQQLGMYPTADMSDMVPVDQQVLSFATLSRLHRCRLTRETATWPSSGRNWNRLWRRRSPEARWKCMLGTKA
jgi:Transcriptional regulatory protein, C terminal